MKLIYLKSALKCDSFDVAIDSIFYSFGYYWAGSLLTTVRYHELFDTGETSVGTSRSPIYDKIINSDRFHIHPQIYVAQPNKISDNNLQDSNPVLTNIQLYIFPNSHTKMKIPPMCSFTVTEDFNFNLLDLFNHNGAFLFN